MDKLDNMIETIKYYFYEILKPIYKCNLYDWKDIHFTMNVDYFSNYRLSDNELHVGIWRDRNLENPYFMVSDDYLGKYCKFVRIDIKTGKILSNKNIFKRLKLDNIDIEYVYELLNTNSSDMPDITNWKYICYLWNSDVMFMRNIGEFDINDWLSGKYDADYSNEEWYISSDTPIPNIHYEERR